MTVARRVVAKQEQFEEKIRLKNQFRALDEDEVDFLDSVLESTRAQEAAVKKDTADQLEAFRKQREEAEKALLGPTSSDVTPAEEEEWSIPARKRRREKGKDLLLPGKKHRASATESEKPALKDQEQVPSKLDTKTPQVTTSGAADTTQAAENPAKVTPAGQKPAKEQAEIKQPAKPAPVALGLAAYGSDSDSE